MTRTAGVAALLCAVLVGCRDDPQRHPVAPGRGVRAAPSAMRTAADSSPLCAAYHRQLATEQAALLRTPRDAQVKNRVAAYRAIIADACR